MNIEVSEEEAGLLASLWHKLDGDCFVAHEGYHPLDISPVDVSSELWALGQIVHRLQQ